MINYLSETFNFFRTKEKKTKLPDYPCAIGRNYTANELKKVGEYMDQEVYFEVEIDPRDNNISLENIPPYYSFSKE